jgi:hypothetical protein
MIVHPRRLGLVTTRRCTAACEHCCFGCSPRTSEAIPIGRLHTLIDEAARIDAIEEIIFTGGECFLLQDALVKLVARVHSYGRLASAVTNGYWAVNEAAARTRLEVLGAAGLRQITFSTGTFHARYVPLERVILGAVLAADSGLNTTILVEYCGQSTFDSSIISTDVRICRTVGAGRLRIEDFTWAPSVYPDPREAIQAIPEHSRFAPGKQTRCATVLDTISVTPDQMLYACCGITMEGIPELALGSVARRSLQNVLAAAQDDLIKLWLHVAGPERILQFVKSKDPEFVLPVESTHPCTTCLHMHRDARAQAVLREHAREVEEAVVAAYLNLRARAG